MNEKFYAVSEEKQQRIINAGFRVFARHPYKKAPVSEIAADAGISKSLLFHYFHNKKEFYFFLWKKVEDISQKYMQEYHCYEADDLFEAMYRGMYAKLKIMELYPDLRTFVIRSFYENEPEIAKEVQNLYAQIRNRHGFSLLKNLDTSKFREGLDLALVQREMYLASEGLLWEITQRGDPLSPHRLEKEFSTLLEFWKSVYYKASSPSEDKALPGWDCKKRKEPRNAYHLNESPHQILWQSKGHRKP